LWNYEVYGLRLQSDTRIDGLIPSTHPGPPDLFLDTSPFLPALDSLFGNLAGEGDDNVAIAPAESGYAVTYRDGTRFFIGAGGSLIRASWPPSSTPEDMATYLLGPLLAFVLRIRGVLCLHASAVVIDGHAVVLAAPHGGGKSTTAARFSDRGVPVMSDDVVPIHWKKDLPVAHAGYPRLRLWDETAQTLYGNVDALPRLTPTWRKRYLDLQSGQRQFAGREQPIGAIFILGERRPGVPSVERLRGHDGAMRLIANTSMGLHLDSAARVGELEGIARLTDRVPVFLAQATDDLQRIDEFCDLIRTAACSAL
jgi:hypothetical protein